MITADEVRAYGRRMGLSREYTEYAATHLFCRVCPEPARLPHHINTRGGHGNIDSPWNLLALCTEHHLEIDQLGNARFCERHPEAREKIEAALARKQSGVAGSGVARK